MWESDLWEEASIGARWDKKGVGECGWEKEWEGEQTGVVGDCQMGESMRGGRGKRGRRVLDGRKDGRVLEWRLNGRVYWNEEGMGEYTEMEKGWESTGMKKGWKSTGMKKG